MEEKSFSENAKGFFGAWKKDYENRNKDILERKKQRDAELDAMIVEMKRLYGQILSDLDSRGKMVFEKMKQSLEAYKLALAKGVDTLKAQMEAEDAILEAEEYAETLPADKSNELRDFTIYSKNQMKELGSGSDLF